MVNQLGRFNEFDLNRDTLRAANIPMRPISDALVEVTGFDCGRTCPDYKAVAREAEALIRLG